MRPEVDRALRMDLARPQWRVPQFTRQPRTRARRWTERTIDEAAIAACLLRVLFHLESLLLGRTPWTAVMVDLSAHSRLPSPSSRFANTRELAPSWKLPQNA